MFDAARVSPEAIIATYIALAFGLSRAPVRVFRRLTSWPMLAALLLVASQAVPRIVVGYVSPCGAQQDTVAAGELLDGLSAYPAGLRLALRRVLHDHPLPPTVSWPRSVQSSHLDCLNLLEVNAHPPLVPIAEPVVAALGLLQADSAFSGDQPRLPHIDDLALV
jgi:hypothetical protein